MKLENIKILNDVEDLIKTKILGVNNMIGQYNNMADRLGILEGKVKNLKQCNLEVK